MASDSPRTVNGFLVFVGSAAAFFGVIIVTVGVLALNRPKEDNSLEQKRAAQRIETASKLEKEVQEKLHSAGWVDKAKGIVHVPVADVLPIVVAELKAKKPAPSQIKVDAPLPMPPPYDPNAVEPAPMALTSSPQGADTVRFTSPATPAPTAPVPATPAAPTPTAAPPAAATPSPAALPVAPEPVAPVKPMPAPEAAPPAPAAPAPEAPKTTPTENSAPAQ